MNACRCAGIFPSRNPCVCKHISIDMNTFIDKYIISGNISARYHCTNMHVRVADASLDAQLCGAGWVSVWSAKHAKGSASSISWIWKLLQYSKKLLQRIQENPAAAAVRSTRIQLKSPHGSNDRPWQTRVRQCPRPQNVGEKIPLNLCPRCLGWCYLTSNKCVPGLFASNLRKSKRTSSSSQMESTFYKKQKQKRSKWKLTNIIWNMLELGLLSFVVFINFQVRARTAEPWRWHLWCFDPCWCFHR